ncbi:MAG TPA: MFS transporter, partial [Solirubrobacteraceae bacterium]|nr:MFS transporter [Solirubrobacteraceae bacterium]
GLTQVGADTSYWLIGVDLFVFGLGMGFTMMPVFTGAMQTIRGAAVARASTALNILQQTGASIGTAVLTVLLASALSSKLGGHATIGAAAAVPPGVRAQVAPPMAAAFGQTFWWALALIAVAFLGSLALPKRRPQMAADETSPAPVPIA